MAMQFKIVSCLAVCLFFACTGAVFAQAGPVTVLAADNALQKALDQFRLALNTAGAEVRSSGTSLTADAQNVITDINTQLGGRLTESIAQLQGFERDLTNHAIELTQHLNTATNEIVSKSTQGAILAIQEGDIAAYDALYALPCRTQTPRIVYATPDFVRVSSPDKEIHLRGNFLDSGDAKFLLVNGVTTNITSKSRNEITFQIPATLMANVSQPAVAKIEVKAVELGRRNFWLFCWNSSSEYALSSSVYIRPDLSYVVKGTINGKFDDVISWSHTFNYQKGDGDCGASYEDDQMYCAPANYSLKADAPSAIAKVSANCNSSIGDPQIAGDRCVKVPAHLGGCGYDNFFVGKNCKGRGFFEYNVTVNAETTNPTKLSGFDFAAKSDDGSQKSFQFSHPVASDILRNATWTYSVTVEIKEGAKTLRTMSAGDGYPDPDGMLSRVYNGTVYINIF